MAKRPPVPAKPESLPPQITAAVRALCQIQAERRVLLHQLFGNRVPLNPTREELIRLIVIQFGEGKTQPIAYYQERLTSIASRSSVRDEIKILDSAGIIILTEAVDDKRVRLVVPAQRLIDWYCEKLPTMITKMMAALTAFGVLIE